MKSKVVVAGRAGGVALNTMVLFVVALACSLAIGSLTSQAQATNPFSAVASPKRLLIIAPGTFAYFGEVSVAEDWMGVELETDMLRDYQNGDRVLGSIYLTGERAYWNNHQGDVGGDCRFSLPIALLPGLDGVLRGPFPAHA